MSRRVIVTRARSDALAWVTELVDAGFDAVALPLIEIRPMPHPQAVRALWQRLHTFDALMFVSSHAVEHFFALRPQHSDAFKKSSTFSTRAFVTGPGSFAALRRAQVDETLIDRPNPDAKVFDSEVLWDIVRARIRPGFRLLIVRGTGKDALTPDVGQGRDWFSQQALAAGAHVEFLAAYQRLCPTFEDVDKTLVQEACMDGSIWIFSSVQAVSNLLTSFLPHSWQQAQAVATHPRIAMAARKAGFAVVCESSPVLSNLIASIESLA